MPAPMNIETPASTTSAKSDHINIKVLGVLATLLLAAIMWALPGDANRGPGRVL